MDISVETSGRRRFQESALCPNGKKQYDLDACGPTLLRVGNVLTVNTSITYFSGAVMCLMNRGDAAAATWTFRGDESRRRRGRDVDIRWRRIAATPRPRRGHSMETNRGDAAAATWIFHGDESRCGRDVDIQRRRGCFRSRPAALRYQGDSKNNTLIDARQPKLKIICTQKPCVPQIWSYSPNAPLRWRVLPPLGEPHIIEGNRMHFNTLEIHHALRNPKDDPFPLTIPFNRRKYKFDDTFDIATHVPELDISEIVLRHGARMRIERVDRDDKRMTVTARQLGPP